MKIVCWNLGKAGKKEQVQIKEIFRRTNALIVGVQENKTKLPEITGYVSYNADPAPIVHGTKMNASMYVNRNVPSKLMAKGVNWLIVEVQDDSRMRKMLAVNVYNHTGRRDEFN